MGALDAQSGQPLFEAKDDATLLAIRRQEEAGIDIVSDGEQARQHFVHGFLAEVDGVDFDKKVRMGIRNNRYDADCPTVTAPLKRRKFVHEREARVARAATSRKLKFTLPGPMTLIDTLADGYYGDRVKMAFAFAELLNQEARDLEKLGVDVIQFDEPAFNVYLGETVEWGVPALEKAAEGLKCTTAVHICYGYGIEANIKWKEALGDSWRQYEQTFPALDRSKIQQVSLECRQSHVPPELMKLLKSKTVLVGAIDVASDKIETPRGSGRDPEARDPVRRSRAHPGLHQLRHGADDAGHRLRQACARWPKVRRWPARPSETFRSRHLAIKYSRHLGGMPNAPAACHRPGSAGVPRRRPKRRRARTMSCCSWPTGCGPAW